MGDISEVCDCISNCVTPGSACMEYYRNLCCPCDCCCTEQDVDIACYSQWWESCPANTTPCLECKSWIIHSDEPMSCHAEYTVENGCWSWSNDDSVGTFHGWSPTGQYQAHCTCGPLEYNAPTTNNTVNVTTWTSPSGLGIDTDGREVTGGLPAGYYIHAATFEWTYYNETPRHFRFGYKTPSPALMTPKFVKPNLSMNAAIMGQIINTEATTPIKLIPTPEPQNNTEDTEDTEDAEKVHALSTCDCTDVTVTVFSTCCLYCTDGMPPDPCVGWTSNLTAKGPAYIDAYISAGDGGCCGPFVPQYGDAFMGGWTDFPLSVTADWTAFDVGARPTDTDPDTGCACSSQWCRDQAHCSCKIYPGCSSSNITTLYLYKNGKFYLNPKVIEFYQRKMAKRKRLAPPYNPKTKKVKLF